MPTLSFLLILGGVLLFYCELIWVGKFIFGIAGCAIALISAARLVSLPHSAIGMWMIAGALLCWITEAFFQTKGLVGLSGGVLLGAGFWKFCITPPIIPWTVAFPVSIVFGVITTWLLLIAKRARLNKRLG